MDDLLVSVAVLLFAWMTAWFVAAALIKRLDVVDTAWGLGFMAVAWFCEVWQPSGRSLLIAVLVSVWGLRLAWHTYRRSQKRGHDDPRYEAISKKWREKFGVQAYLSIYLLQGVLIFVIGLPIVLATGKSLGASGWLAWIGALVWLKGFVTESLADWQLSRFLAQPGNKGKVMQSGLWRYSRHPNYYGEIVQWLGIGLIACGASWGWVSLAGPVVLALMIRYVSGIPPIEGSRKHDDAYQDYARRTNAIVPGPSLRRQ